MSAAAIARSIGRHRSVVGGEIARNQGPDGTYFGSVAHVRAFARTRRPKEFKLIANDGLCRRIAGWMDDGWSPGLIALVLAELPPAWATAASTSCSVASRSRRRRASPG